MLARYDVSEPENWAEHMIVAGIVRRVNLIVHPLNWIETSQQVTKRQLSGRVMRLSEAINL
jgi:hypothetical protein